MENLTGTSPVGSAQDGVSSKRIRLRTYEIIQKCGAFKCRHCNHRSDRIHHLEIHENHHSANLQFRCPFCTFSSKSASTLGYHVNRVHLDQKESKLLDECPLAKRMQVNGDVMEQGNEKETLKEGISGEEHPENLSTPRKQHTGSPPSGEEEVMDITMDFDEEEMADGEPIELLGLSHGDRLDPRKLDEHGSTSTKPLPRSSESPVLLQEEEDACRSELSNLVPEIQETIKMLLQTKKSYKKSRAMQATSHRSANDLRKKMEGLETWDHHLSVQLTVLMEHDESFQQRLKELAAQKAQLKEEIDNLRHVAISKRIKIKGSDSTAADLESKIRQKRRMLTDATEKLAATLVERTRLATRIRGFEDERRENTRVLVEMRADYSLLQDLSASESTSIGIQLKALVREQCMRIERYVTLEKKLAKIRFDNAMNEIERKKEQWLDALQNFD